MPWNTTFLSKKFMKKIPVFLLGCMVCLSLILNLTQQRSVSAEEKQEEFGKALELFEKKDYGSAIKAFDALRSQYSELSDYISFFLIRAYAKSAKDSEALLLSQHFLQQFPSHPLRDEVALLEASVLLRGQRFKEALESYRTLLMQQNVPEERLFYAIGQAFLALGKKEDAVNAFQRLLQFYPAHSDVKAARKALRNILASQPELRPAWTEGTLFAYAEKLLESGLYSSAITQHKKFQAVYPVGLKFGASELSLAEAYLRSRKLKEGQRLLEQIAERYAQSHPEIAAEALYTLGRRSWNADRNLEAKRFMQRIITEFRTSLWGDDAYYILGRIYQSQHSYQAAAQCYRSLSTQYPESSFTEEALFRAGWSLYLAPNYPKASQLFLQAATAFPSGKYAANGRFWLGKSLEAEGETESALKAYRSVLDSSPGTYYAVLAQNSLRVLAGAVPVSQRISGKIPTLPNLLADLQQKVSDRSYRHVVTRVRKAVALHRLELSHYARGEITWIGGVLESQALPSGDAEGQAWRLYFLARLYEQIDEHLSAIRLGYRISAMMKAETLKAFPYAFEYIQYPLLHEDLIREYAAEHSLDPFLVAGLIRQESAYNAKVTSPAGARGLMQIMPKTGKQVARALGLKNYSATRLFEPELNITLGTAYLASLFEDFDGNLFRAIAAYNAGPKATKKWWTKERAGLEEEIVENISYNETRSYVKYVLRNYERYRQLYPELVSSEE